MRWLRQPEIHQRHQTLAAGQNFTLVAKLLEQAKRLIDSARSMICEVGRLHSLTTFLRQNWPRRFCLLPSDIASCTAGKT
jgi:hypothetical protein